MHRTNAVSWHSSRQLSWAQWGSSCIWVSLAHQVCVLNLQQRGFGITKMLCTRGTECNVAKRVQMHSMTISMPLWTTTYPFHVISIELEDVQLKDFKGINELVQVIRSLVCHRNLGYNSTKELKVQFWFIRVIPETRLVHALLKIIQRRW